MLYLSSASEKPSFLRREFDNMGTLAEITTLQDLALYFFNIGIITIKSSLGHVHVH